MRALADPAVDSLLWRGRTARAGWLLLGLLFVGIGLVGIFVPLLPTMDFLLLALPCFARSSPRLEEWLLNHPRFGPGLRAWRATRAVPRRAKVAAGIGMAVGYALFWLHVRPGWCLALAVAGVMIASLLWIVRRPRPEDEA